MAIFEYKCKLCELVFEKIFTLGKAPKQAKCPECKKKANRFFSPPMVQFKGPGFYSTDSRGTTGSEDKK